MADALGNDGNASMPEQVKRPNPWRKMMMMIIIMVMKENETKSHSGCPKTQDSNRFLLEQKYRAAVLYGSIENSGNFMSWKKQLSNI